MGAAAASWSDEKPWAGPPVNWQDVMPNGRNMRIHALLKLEVLSIHTMIAIFGS